MLVRMRLWKNKNRKSDKSPIYSGTWADRGWRAALWKNEDGSLTLLFEEGETTPKKKKRKDENEEEDDIPF